MKLFHVALAGSLMFSGAALAGEVTQTMHVSGWHCEGCAGKTESALKGAKGVKSATANLDKKEVQVTYDDTQTKKADLEAIVTKQHYKVESWQ